MADDTKWYDNNYVKAAGVAAGAISNIAAGGRTTGVGNAMSTIGTGLSALPGPAGLVGMGLNVAGGIFNTLAGAKFNEKNIAAVESNTNTLRNFNSNASTYDQLADNISNMAGQMAFDDKFIGSWGILGGRGKVARKAEKLRQDQRDAFNYAQATIENNMNNIATTQTQDMLANYAANGGPLVMHKGALTPFGNRFDEGGSLRGPLHSYGTDWDDGLTFVNTGGTHEQNPNDGVQMGMDEEGTPNLVEEGEVVWNDYVFSKRMKVPKAIRSKYKLREQKELSYADAVKKEQKALEERPNDPIEKRTVDDMLLKLAVSQEEQRQMKEMRRQQREQQQALQYAYGGITIKPSKRGTFTTAAKKHGKSVQEFASQVLANPEDYSPAMRKKANFARNAAKWHSDGGNLFAIGGPKGRMLPGPGDQPNYLYNPLAYRQNVFPTSAPYGYIYPPQNEVETEAFTTGAESQALGYAAAVQGVSNDAYKKAAIAQGVSNPTLDKVVPTTPPAKSQKDSWLTKLRFIPALGAGINVLTDLAGWTNKPDYTNANAILEASKGIKDVRPEKLGDYMTYNPFDRMFYINQANANAGASRRALLNTTAGNRGAAAANILASDYAKIGNLGDLARKAEEYNLGQREKVATFNRDTNKFNIENDLKAQIANNSNQNLRMDAAYKAAQLRDAVDARIGTAKSLHLTNLFDNLGNIGWEEFNRNMVNSSNPLYNLDRSGNVRWTAAGLALSDSARKEIEDQVYKSDEYIKTYKKNKSRANGGYLTIKRRRR